MWDEIKKADKDLCLTEHDGYWLDAFTHRRHLVKMVEELAEMLSVSVPRKLVNESTYSRSMVIHRADKRAKEGE